MPYALLLGNGTIRPSHFLALGKTPSKLVGPFPSSSLEGRAHSLLDNRIVMKRTKTDTPETGTKTDTPETGTKTDTPETLVIDLTAEDTLDEQVLFNPRGHEFVDIVTVRTRIPLFISVLDAILSQRGRKHRIPVLKWNSFEAHVNELLTKTDDTQLTTVITEEFKKQLKTMTSGNIVLLRNTVEHIRDVLTKIADLCKSEDTAMLSYTAFRYQNYTHLRRDTLRNILEYVLKLLSVPMYSLRLYGQPRGLVTGDFTIAKKDGSAKIVANDTNSYSLEGAVGIGRDILAPEDQQKWKYDIEFATKIRSIVIVESKSIFEFLRLADFHTKNKCMIVTGSGYPDHATRRFVRQVFEQSKNKYGKDGIPVYGVSDCNPHGMDIVSKYEKALGCKIDWIGAWPSQVKAHATLSTVKENEQKLDKKDRSMLRGCLKTFVGTSANRFAEVKLMQAEKKKYEFEIFESVCRGYSIEKLEMLMQGADAHPAVVNSLMAGEWSTSKIKVEKNE
jgi:DNA topoisomerase VI subunit A